jgi:hypothetical protein
VLFWEDICFGNCSLAISFWDLYTIANEQNCTIDSVWDGVELKISFRRTVSKEIYLRWLALCNLMASFSFSEEEDTPVWMFHPSGSYNVKSFMQWLKMEGLSPYILLPFGNWRFPLEFMYSCGCLLITKL